MPDESTGIPAVIVEDVADDRESLVEELKQLRPDLQIVDIDTLSGIQEYMRSGKSAGVVFLDLNLHETGRDHLDEGLYSLYEWWEARPEVPICIVSGYAQRFAADLMRALIEIDSLIDVLDKLTYDNDRVRDALARADLHRGQYRQKLEHEALVLEQLESGAKRDRKGLEDGRKLYDRAFTGNDWPERIKAEQRLSNHATISGIEIYRRIERELRGLLSDDEWDQLLSYSCRFYRCDVLIGGNGSFAKRLRHTWNTRNKVVHKPFLSMSDTDALAALEILEELQRARLAPQPSGEDRTPAVC